MKLVPYTLVLLRHGQSAWNLENLFTGWIDVDLTDLGREEARRGGADLARAALLPDVVHTSLQIRAIRTAELALEACTRTWIPVRRSWRLNERHYGDLQGKDKKETAAQFGPDQLKLWRRSYDVRPPALDPMSDKERWGYDDRYAALYTPPQRAAISMSRRASEPSSYRTSKRRSSAASTRCMASVGWFRSLPFPERRACRIL